MFVLQDVEIFFKKRIAFVATTLMMLAAILLSSCGTDSLKGHWARNEKRSIKIYSFQNGKFTYTILFLFLNISYRGTYKVSKGQIEFKIKEFLNLDAGEWVSISSMDLEESLTSSNETFSYNIDNIEENVLVMDGDAYTRLSDNEYSELLGEEIINFFQ